jgi:peptide/nickel transport system permease protein
MATIGSPEAYEDQMATAVTGIPPEEQVSLGTRVRGSRYLNASLIGGIAILAILLIGSFVVPWLSRWDPWVPNPAEALQSPSGSHWFGTDESGFDVFVRVFYAPRIDLYLCVVGVAIAAVLGVTLGVLAGFSRGWLSEFTMRLADLVQAFPLLILALAIVAIAGPSNANVIGAIAFINLPIFFRLVRTRVLGVREQRYVEVAEALGNPTRRIVFKHVLPNAIEPAIVQLGISLGYAIAVLAGLAFLGVGVQVPTPEWGSMIRTGSENLTTGGWWTFTFPGIFLALAVIGFNLVSEGISAAREVR